MPMVCFQYLHILHVSWLQGFQDKIVNFLSSFCALIPKNGMDTMKTPPNEEVCPESLRAMLFDTTSEFGFINWVNNVNWPP